MTHRNAASTCATQWKMWQLKVFSAICFTAVCAAQDLTDPQDEPPVPSLHLQSSWFDVFTFEKVEFNCSLPGSSNWTFTWSRNGQEVQDSDSNLSAEGSKLTITAATQIHSGSYTCKGHHKTRKVTTAVSNSIELTVKDPPVPSLRLLSPWVDVFENETVEFSCDFGVSSDWTFTWYRNQEQLEEDFVLTMDAEEPLLNISLITQAYQGGYACKAHLESRRVSSGFSNTVNVTVYENTPKPTLSKHPGINPMYVGETVNFTCDVDVSTGWEYHWYKDGEQHHESSKTISINLGLSSGGEYSCIATRGETSTEISEAIPQDVFEIPVPSLKLMTQWLDVFPAESVKLSCGMDNSSDWIYTWHKDGQKVQADNVVSFGLNEATLSISSASSAHAGQYNCEAHLNGRSVISSPSSALTLTVHDKKPGVTLMQDPDYRLMFPGESVFFSCHINVSSGWEYLWYKDEKSLDVSGNKYTISPVGLTSQGSYKCQAKRGTYQVFLSDSSRVIHLKVEENKPKPSMTQQPDVDKVYTGESVSFECKVELSSGWEYFWYKDGAQLSVNSSRFNIDDASALNIGTYECGAKRSQTMYDTERSDGRILHISEIPVPSLKRTTQWLDVFPAESVKLSCGMDNSSDWIYTWHKDGQKVQADNVVSFGPNEATLSISSASAAHAGQYNCEAHLNGRSVNSSPSSELTLTVHDKKPGVTLMQDPDYRLMFPGESVFFSCHINVSSGWEYLWYKDEKSLDVSGNKYTISPVGLTSQGSYKCQAKRGTYQVFLSDSSRVIHLKVEENKPKPSMTQQPDVDKVYTGESVSFECKVELSSGWEYFWYKDGAQLSVNSSRFNIDDASALNIGTYECGAKRSQTMYDTERSDGRILHISEIPVPSLKRTTQWLDVFPAESVKLSCGMDGTSDWTYMWYRDGQNVQAGDALSFDSDATTLSISSASAKHRGRYSCSAKLKSRSVNSNLSSALTLHVYDSKPRVILMQNPNHNVMHTGDSVSFICHFNVSSGWEYLWYKDGSPLTESRNNLTITSVLTKNTGSYKCQTKRGSDRVFRSDPSPAVRLDIKERPKADIILLTGWSEVFSTDSLVLKCGVQDSQDTWNYTWFKEDQPVDLPPSEKHTVTPQNDPKQSLYTCQGIRMGRPSYSKTSDHYKTKNLLLKRRVLLSISGCIFFGIIVTLIGCIVLRVIRKPAEDEYKPEEADLFLNMGQLKNSDDTPCPLFQYITDAALNASPKEGDENGTICSETTPLPITSQKDEALTTESNNATEDNGGLVSFKQ